VVHTTSLKAFNALVVVMTFSWNFFGLFFRVRFGRLKNILRKIKKIKKIKKLK